jgi:hypothetical protein
MGGMELIDCNEIPYIRTTAHDYQRGVLRLRLYSKSQEIRSDDGRAWA